MIHPNISLDKQPVVHHETVDGDRLYTVSSQNASALKVVWNKDGKGYNVGELIGQNMAYNLVNLLRTIEQFIR